MNETTLTVDQLQRAFDGPAWSGPSVMEILTDVSAAQAAFTTASQTHSIWELVLHILSWEAIALRRIEGESYRAYPAELDWPAVKDTSESAWKATIERLKAGHAALCEGVTALQPDRLSALVPGAEYSFYVMLHGVVQHDLYHAGQIALLKKFASDARPSAVRA